MVRHPHSAESRNPDRICQAEPGIGGARLQVQRRCVARGKARRRQVATRGWDSGVESLRGLHVFGITAGTQASASFV